MDRPTEMGSSTEFDLWKGGGSATVSRWNGSYAESDHWKTG